MVDAEPQTPQKTTLATNREAKRGWWTRHHERRRGPLHLPLNGRVELWFTPRDVLPLRLAQSGSIGARGVGEHRGGWRMSAKLDGGRCWEQVLSRSPQADGAFVYAVRTTGIYCRPSCRSRRPLQKNVLFFASGEEARREGFRACLRCAPDDRAPHAALIERACGLLHGDEPVSGADLASALGVSKSFLYRVFRAELGITPAAYRRRRRREKAREALARSESVTSAVYESGFNASSRFYEDVGPELGMPPKQLRAGGRGEAIEYTAAPCSLGTVLVAWTLRGVCAVELGDTAEDAAKSLRRRFAHASLIPTEEGPWLEAVVRAVEEGIRPEFPLDVRGTHFQEHVWAILREIPPGETRTYTQIAEAMGRPTAARAIANAIGKNPVAVVIPCHRVVRSDGSLAGYRWGTERKRRLLDREA